jgi:hypothetical protein
MPFVTQVGSLDEEIDVLIAENLSPSARSAALAEFAKEQLAEAETANAAATGTIPRHETYVDGQQGGSIDRVKPDGEIIFDFDLMTDVLRWIDKMLIEFSPVRTGRYQHSHKLFVDGHDVDPNGVIPAGTEYVLMNTQPYAEEIENDLSRQAPHGVFHVIAVLASQRFAQVAKIEFAYRDFEGIGRRPAIVITEPT